MQTWTNEALLSGVIRFAGERGWEVDASMRWTQEVPDLNSGDCVGVIAQIGSGAKRGRLLRRIRSAGLPVVDVHGDVALPFAVNPA